MRTQNEELSHLGRPDSSHGPTGTPVQRSATETEMTRIWEDVLETKGIRTQDDFFEIGGTSLALIRIFGLIKEHFGVALEVEAAIEAATIAHLSMLIDKSANASS
jgi:acyl carrier protein